MATKAGFLMLRIKFLYPLSASSLYLLLSILFINKTGDPFLGLPVLCCYKDKRRLSEVAGPLIPVD